MGKHGIALLSFVLAILIVVPTLKANNLYEPYLSFRPIPDYLASRLLRVSRHEFVNEIVVKEFYHIQSQLITGGYKGSIKGINKNDLVDFLSLRERLIKQNFIVKKISSMFLQYDRDLDSVVTGNEFEAFAKMNYYHRRHYPDQWQNSELETLRRKELFASDVNKDNLVTYQEFVNFWRNSEEFAEAKGRWQIMGLRSKREKPLSIEEFDLLDLDKDGILTLRELKILAQKAYFTVDENQDHMISEGEFKTFCAVRVSICKL